MSLGYQGTEEEQSLHRAQDAEDRLKNGLIDLCPELKGAVDSDTLRLEGREWCVDVCGMTLGVNVSADYAVNELAKSHIWRTRKTELLWLNHGPSIWGFCEHMKGQCDDDETWRSIGDNLHKYTADFVAWKWLEGEL